MEVSITKTFYKAGYNSDWLPFKPVACYIEIKATILLFNQGSKPCFQKSED